MKLNQIVASFAFALLVFGNATAGPASQFICHGEQPYEHVQVVTKGGRSEMVSSLAGRTTKIDLGGEVPAGQSLLIAGRGLFAVPLRDRDGPRVDIYSGGKRVGTVRGMLDVGDVASGRLLLQTHALSSGHKPEDPHDAGQARVTQTVIGADGAILGQRHTVESLNEDRRVWRLTAAGDGIHLQPTELNPSSKLEVLSLPRFQPVLSVDVEGGLKFTDLVMKNVREGFAIGNGQIYRIADGKLRPLTSPEDAFSATRVSYDPRIDRLLVNGQKGFWIFDGKGRKLLAQRGLSSVRMTIEGDVVEVSGKERVAKLWQHQGVEGYQDPVPLSFDAIPNWNAISCMTARTAAVIERDAAGERGRLVRYRD